MIIKQKFTEPEIEVKWYWDSIEEIVIIYVRIQKRAQRHSCLHLLHSTSTSVSLALIPPSLQQISYVNLQAYRESEYFYFGLWFRNRDPRLQRPAASTFYILAIVRTASPVSQHQGQESASCILAIGSGQRILYRLGSGLWQCQPQGPGF